MSPEQIETAAAALATARQGQPISRLPETARPQSEAECYAIQDAVLRRLRENVGGYKVGFSPEGGIFCAPIYASRVHASPARLPARDFHLIGIECEIGFRVNQALPARATPYSRDEVLAAASLHPTIEVVDSRYQDFRSLDRLQVLADNFSNGALVYGAAASGWQGMDLVHPPIAVTADGKPFADCTGLRAGDPIGLFVELVNFVANKRGGVFGRRLRHDRHAYRNGVYRAGGDDPGGVRSARPRRGVVPALGCRAAGRAARAETEGATRQGTSESLARKKSIASPRLRATRSRWRPLSTMNSAGCAEEAVFTIV